MNNNKIKELENELINKSTMLLLSKKEKDSENASESNFTLKRGEKLMAVNFMPVDQSFIRPISCKNTDTLVKLEQIIYDEYPEFKDCNTYLTVNGSVVKRFKTLEENGIKDSSGIAINTYE